MRICVGYFSGCRDKGPGRSLSQKEMVIPAHGLRRAVVDCGKGGHGGRGVGQLTTGHLQSGSWSRQGKRLSIKLHTGAGELNGLSS